MDDYGIGLGILAVFGAFLFFFLIIGIILYVLFAIGLFNMAKNKNLENPWMAWVPILQLYVLGKLIKKLSIGSIKIINPELVLPIASAVVIVLGGIPVIGFLLSIADVVLMIVALYTLYKMYKPESATLYTVLSVIFGFLAPIFVFMMRNNKPIEEGEEVEPTTFSVPEIKTEEQSSTEE